MLNDITLGQYYPTDSVIHRMDPRMKIIITILLIVAVFVVPTLWGYIPVVGYIALAAAVAKVPFGKLLKGLKPLRLILVLTFILNLFFNSGETVLLHWQFITITKEGLMTACHYSLRLIFLVTGTSLLTLTTSPVSLSDGL